MTRTNKRKITVAGAEHEILIIERRANGFISIEYDGVPFELFLGDMETGNRLAFLEGSPLKVGEVTNNQGTYTVLVNDKRIPVLFPQISHGRILSHAPPEREVPKPHLSGRKGGRVIAHMPGRIVSVRVKIGDSVKLGDPILVLLAMKMENTIVAPSSGVVSELHVDTGVSVNKGDLLAVIE